jgi:hypothetical protein
LSNGLSIKSKQLNLKYRDIENEISLLENQNNVPSNATYIDTPILLERNTLDLALSAGLTKEEIFGNSTPTSDIDLEGIKNALDSVKVNSNYDTRLPVTAEFQGLQHDSSTLKGILMLINADVLKIGQTLDDRSNGVKTSPQINYDLIDSLIDKNALSELDKTTLEEHKNLVLNKVVRPLQENKIALKAYRAQEKDPTGDPTASGQFDLIYGPPVSTKGQFVLTEDGLYYDSRSGGLPDIAVRKVITKDWNLEFNPNQGGKGIHYDDMDLNTFSNTIFSYDYTVTNNNVDKLYYIDKVLAGIENSKAKIVNDVSSQITDLLDSGYDASSALVQNYYRSLASHATSFNNQIKKRRKQLQIAGLFGGFIITDNNFQLGPDVIMKELVGEEARKIIKSYGSDSEWTFSTDYKYATITRNSRPHAFRIYSIIPINDFSYLKGTGLNPTIDTQNKTLLQSADIEDIILPIEPKFLKSSRSNSIFLSEFSIPRDGIGSLPYFSETTDVSGSGPLIKSLTDNITTEGLIVMYNFVKGNLLTPTDDEYQLKNEAHIGAPLNGKLVGFVSSMFLSGFGIARLGGTLYDPDLSENPEPWYEHIVDGGYVLLPNNCRGGKLYKGSNIIDDLTYNTSGFSFDTWVHLPEYSELFSDDHRYRLIVGCENTGPGKNKNSTGVITASRLVDDLANDKVVDYEKVHGMIMGFAINPNVTGNFEADDIVFGIWPTVSQNSPNGKWGPSVAIAEKVIGRNPLTATKTKLGMVIPNTILTNAGIGIDSTSSTFAHLNVSFDYHKDRITVYLDAQVLATSSISQCFNTNPGEPLNIPSPTYSTTNPDDLHLWSWGVNLGKQGESLRYARDRYYESIHKGLGNAPSYPLFTPWVIGGGFTDSIPRSKSLERTLGRNLTPLGFLGSNTNDSYFTGGVDTNGGVKGQHSPSIGGSKYQGLNRDIPRSGLDGFLGSFKIYNRPLSLKEVERNYDAQQGFFKFIRLIDDPQFFVESGFTIAIANTIPFSRRSTILGFHGITGAITEQLSSLNRFYRGVSAIGDANNLSATYLHTKLFTTEPSIFNTNGFQIQDEVYLFVDRAKRLGYKVKLTFGTCTQSSSLGGESTYSSVFNTYCSAITYAIASSLRTPRTITQGSLSYSYSGYDIDTVMLENEPDLTWSQSVNGSASGYATFIVSALKEIRSRLITSSIPVPKLGPGGWSNYRKTEWWTHFFNQCSAQGYSPSSFSTHSYNRNGTKFSQFDILGKIRRMAASYNVVSSFDLNMDEYNIDFFPTSNDNPNGITPECDNHRAAACLASYEIEALKNNFQASLFFIHDKIFTGTNVSYTDDWSGKSPGLFLVSGAPKPIWWAKQMVSRVASGSTIINPTRNASTSAQSWSHNCIASINSDDEMAVMVVNAPLSDPDAANSQASGYYREDFLDFLAFSNWDSSGYFNQFMSAIGQGLEYTISGYVQGANRNDHDEWGIFAIYYYVMDVPASRHPFTSTSSYANKIITADDLSAFVLNQGIWADATPSAGVPNFHANNPTWLSSIVAVKTQTRSLISSTNEQSRIVVNFDSNYVPTRISKQYLIDRDHNIPSSLPEFDISDPNSAYSRLRSDFPINLAPSSQEARYNAIDYGIDPVGKTYNFGTAGQYQELQGEDIAFLDVLNNQLVTYLRPNSVALIILERT